MRHLRDYSIRYTMPAALAVLAAMLTGLSAALTWRTENRQLATLLEQRAAAIGNLVVPRIERSLAQAPAGNVVSELAGVVVAPGVALALVCDEKDRVLFCTEADWNDLDLAKTASAAARPLLQRARATFFTQIEKSPDGAIIRAVFPFTFAPLPGELRPSRIGGFCLEMDLAGSQRSLRATIVERSAMMGGLACLLCLGAWAYFHFRFARRVDAIVTAVTDAGRGQDFPALANQGRDELGVIGSAFNRMAAELRHTLETLRANEARLRLIGDNLPDCMVYQVRRDDDGTARFLYLSAGVERLRGVSVDDALRDASLIFRQVADADRPAMAAAEAESQASMTVFNVTARVQRPDGSVRWMQIHARPHRDAEGRWVWDGIEVDITDRRQREEELHGANRALRAFSRCNRALVHAHDEDALLQEVCDIIVGEGVHRLAWVGYAEHDEQKSVRVVARAGADQAYLSNLNVSWADEPRGRGPTGTAIRTGEPEMCRDFRNDPRVAPWREAALAHGIRSSLVFPLRRDGAVLGALTIYSTAPDAFDPIERDLLAELAGDLAYGIGALRTKAALRASEERYRDAMYDSAIGMAIVGLDGRWLEVNPALCRTLGYTRDELVALDFQSVTLPEDLPASLETVGRLVGGVASTWEKEKRYRHKSGRTVWAQLSLAVVRDAAGRPLHFVSQIQDITERKQAEFERERLARAIDAHYDGAYWMDAGNRFVYVNDAACRALGYTRDELLGRHVSMIAPKATAERLESIWRRLREKGSFATEALHLRKDGTTFPVEVSSTYIQVGGVEFNCGFARDITQRRQAENVLRESEEKFSKIFQGAPVSIMIADLASGSILEMNEEGLRLAGFRREEVVGRRATDLGWLTEGERLRLVEDLRNQGHVSGRAMAFRDRSGQVVHGLVSCDVIEIGGRSRLLYAMADITARKEAESALAAAADRLALALRASKFGIWRHNLQTGDSEWDARMFALFDLPEAAAAPSLDAILGRVVAEDRGAVRRSWHALPSCDRSYQIRFRLLRPEGKLRHIELQGIVRDDPAGRPEWAIGVAGDITEIVQATAESERLRSQLIQSQKMETLGTLAAGVAHDFNNLLTGINGFVELASASLGPGHEAAELLRQARRGAMSARDLVRRILGFSRQNPDNRRVLLDAVEVIRDTAPLVAAVLPANVSLSLTVDCDAGPVLADSGQVQQVLLNLCTNAAHAIGGKAGQVQIGVRLCDLGFGGDLALPPGCGPGRYVRITVRDTGCGMNEETRSRIFEPFFTTKDAGVGTGLGLPIVRDIVTSHEGGMDVSSVVGEGSTFAVYLPLAQKERELHRPDVVGMGARGTGQRVLIVDDEPSVATVVRLTLKRGGYEPVVFTSSPEAWKGYEAAAGNFDLVIVDQNMPEISGPEFVGRVRVLSPAQPILMMSGRFETGPALAALKVEQIKKPFEIADLLASVRATLERSAVKPDQS